MILTTLIKQKAITITQPIYTGGNMTIIDRLTPRTRIEYRVTIDPANLGYGGKPTDWRSMSPDAVGTPATILRHAAEYRRRSGITPGTTYADEYRTPFGVISDDQIREYCYSLGCKR